MGRLFTYMVKAAAGEQPTPYIGSYGTWGNSDMSRPLSGVYELPFFWAGSVRDRNKAIDRLFSASQNVDSWQALADKHGNNWGANYLTAIDSRFTSPEAVYDALSANRDYLEAIRHFANTGSYDKLDKLTSLYNRDNPNYVGSGYARYKNGLDVHKGTDYDLADGVGNAQLVINTYLAEQARRKKAKESNKDGDAQQLADPQPADPTVKKSSEPAVAALQAPQPASSAQPDLSAAAASVKKFGERVVGPMVRNVARQVRYAFRPELKVHDTIQQNIAAGRSMYAGMTPTTRGMTEGQRQALSARGFAGNQQQQDAALAAARDNARKNGQQLPQSEHAAYTGAGLRMVGHSADGNTRTYVGKSGRGRITVGDNAQAGHYRGVGAVDTNTRSNYADLRQPTTTRSVTPPPVSTVRKLPTPARR